MTALDVYQVKTEPITTFRNCKANTDKKYEGDDLRCSNLFKGGIQRLGKLILYISLDLPEMPESVFFIV